MVTIFLPEEKNMINKSFYPQSRLNALGNQDRDRHFRVRHPKRAPSAYEQKDHNRPVYLLEGNYKKKTKSFISDYMKPLHSEIVQEQSTRINLNSLVSRKLKPLREIYSHSRFHYISKIKHNLYPYVIEENIDEETDEGENREKENDTWRKTPDPRKKYLNSLLL
ncbi:hypothetical protein SteCoe_25855 [Stentor coeruleus]|uniref:Uncharacterized protein n=1 Tax=Stentor coeruleus TaxID=5963 RepID=A0A1R2BE78_9CILI|nr:hypothetical protein SteCoe_25855 [Stentor coeruleus]